MPYRFILMMLSFVIICLSLATAKAQQTAFTYQGKLTDNGSAANGNYDLQFALFDIDTGGNQIGATQSIVKVPVTGGVFTVTLDFGPAAFNGLARFLEISTRPTGDGAFTLLTPRQPITATPYAVRSMNSGVADLATDAQRLGGVSPDQYVKTDDARLTDPRSPTTGSSNYIQNTATAQANSNFNISGNGTAGGTLSGNFLNAVTQYNLGGQRVLSAQPSSQNTFLGFGAGINTTGTRNSFYGNNAGRLSTNAAFNAFFGDSAGLNNTTGSGNSFFGMETGKANTTGSHNVFVGDQAGFSNTTGNSNVMIGDAAGFSITVEHDNTFIGDGSDGEPGITNATAIGANSKVTTSDSLVLGNNVNVGIGVSAPGARLHVVSPFAFGLRVQTDTPHGAVASFGGYGYFMIDAPGDPGGRFFVGEDGKVGIGTIGPFHRLEVVDQGNTGLRVRNLTSGGEVASFGGNGDFNIDSLSTQGGRLSVKQNGWVGIGTNNPGSELDVKGAIKFIVADAGNLQLCRNSFSLIALCSSSLRYKADLRPFNRGLDLIDRLHPITFKWKTDQTLDLGLGAEDVAAVEPLLVTHNDKGEIEGVKYDRLTVVLINAVKEQQALIERQQARIARLETIVCSSRRRARVCK